MLQYANANLTFAEIDLSDAVDRGITVTEISAMDQPIDVSPETSAAFIGRALRGPVDTPVLVHHFGEFRRQFGDCWSRSSLGPAVKQFFEHGGKELYVVRVSNNGRGAMLCLSANGSALVLRAAEPGSTERIRAAVDYDRIDAGETEFFNLTLQRLDPQNGLIIDQEIHRKLSFVEGAESFVADVLSNSTIAEVEHPYPVHRPEATVNQDSRYELEWVEPVQSGTDGAALTDYDLIGSRQRSTGMFALEDVEHFDTLYFPPSGEGVDPGPAAVLAAEIFCRRRGAMLIVDPPVKANTAHEAVEIVGDLGYASPNIVSYFPRIQYQDDDEAVSRAAGGAIAGLLCKLDRTEGPWGNMHSDLFGFQRHIRPTRDLGADEKNLLMRAGLNAIAAGPAGRARFEGGVTMGRGSELQRVFTRLPVRRLCNRVTNTVDLATRWAVFEAPQAKLSEHIQGQVSAYFSYLYDIGAFASDNYVVQCDAGIARFEEPMEHGVTLLLGFHPTGSDEPVSFTLHQSVRGCRVTTTAFAPAARRCA